MWQSEQRTGRHAEQCGLASHTALPYDRAVRTGAETPVFRRYAADVWTDAEHDEVITFIAGSPAAGSVIPGSGGRRKVRWSAAGAGKRGGARVIYFIAPDGVVWLLIVYKKSNLDNLPTSFIAELKRVVEDAL
jgi:hypothetical protein